MKIRDGFRFGLGFAAAMIVVGFVVLPVMWLLFALFVAVSGGVVSGGL